ncbi:MAG TPA: DUF2867 domain-containing protein [Amycolatopsis sp.]|nr:DUF2867 domain-containing protein [Amycolatopsis sp.]
MSLREFVAGALGWSPGWLKILFGARYLLARALRLDTAGIPRSPRVRAEDVGFAPGDRLSFFTVRAGDEDRYLVLGVDDNHLNAHLTVVAEPISGTRKRFQLGTIVHYKRRAGRFYFALIKPCHHLVIRGMLHAGVARRA